MFNLFKKKKVKFCKNCKYHKLSDFTDRVNVAICTSPNQGRDYVTGELYASSCSGTRYSRLYCGKAAIWFKQK